MSENAVELLSSPYGEVAYETFRKYRKAIVDKSLKIKELDSNNISRYPVLLRPRRFGKSTFVQMLKCFYDISYQDRYDEIFSDKDIYKENLASHNTYHVIDFDFSGVSAKKESTLIRDFFIAVRVGINDFMVRYPDFNFNLEAAEKETPSGLIKSFFEAYRRYSAKQSLYVMIDEYDNFANSVLSQDLVLFKEITSTGGFLKDFYAAIKEGAKNCIAKTFITGVSSVSLDSLTSGFNIARNVTSNACFNEYAGFTEDELAILIPQLVDVKKIGVSVDEIIASMKPVYDGYCFSMEAEHTVFNSSMSLYYLDEMRTKGRFLSPEKCLDPASDHDGSKLQQLFNIAEDGIADDIIDSYLKGNKFFIEALAENINLNKAARYNYEQILSMFYYLGYLTIDKELSDSSALALKIPNLYMSKLFAQCVMDLRLKTNEIFNDAVLDITALEEVSDDISTFATSCTEFLSTIFTNPVLTHINEMALNLTLYTKLKSMRRIIVEMQKLLSFTGDTEKFADLVITVNKGKSNECIYLIELKYIAKTKVTNNSSIESLITKASEQVLKYKSARDFKNKQVKAYAMVFVGSNCVYCEQQ